MNFPLTRPRISCVFLFFCGEITNQYLCLIKQAQLSRFHSCFSCINFARVLLERLGVGVGGDCPRTKRRWADGAWGRGTLVPDTAQRSGCNDANLRTQKGRGKPERARAGGQPRLSAQTAHPRPRNTQPHGRRSRRLRGPSPCPMRGCPRWRRIWREGDSEGRPPRTLFFLTCCRGREGGPGAARRRAERAAGRGGPGGAAALGLQAVRAAPARGPLSQPALSARPESRAWAAPRVPGG